MPLYLADLGGNIEGIYWGGSSQLKDEGSVDRRIAKDHNVSNDHCCLKTVSRQTSGVYVLPAALSYLDSFFSPYFVYPAQWWISESKKKIGKMDLLNTVREWREQEQFT
jgi:hypothetical protein